MSERENVLQRWSRRKREAAGATPSAEAKKAGEAAAGQQDAPDASKAEALKNENNNDSSFDISKLPRLDSIGADSDVRAFMQPDVPSALRHAALRRAWSADTDIRDFIGLIENGWDFNDPDGIPGFGPLKGEDIARLLAQAVGEPQADEEPDTDTVPAARPLETTDAPGPSDTATDGSDASHATTDGTQAASQSRVQMPEYAVREPTTDIAMQNETDVAPARPIRRRRGHGGALPT